MKVAIYARKSNEQDDVAIRSVDAQITECKQLAVANGWTIGNTFIDDNVSGGTWKRPGLDALFASLDGIDVVLVEEQKALARDYRLLIGILGDFEDSDVEVHSVQEGHIDISTFEGQVIVGTRGAADAKVRKDASVRGIRTFRQKFLAGHACGVQPFGFTTEEALDSDGKKYRKRVIVEEQAEIVRRIFRMYAEGYGHRAICRDLNIEGVLFPKPHIRKDGMVTTGWAPSTVKTILKRESYIAIFHYNKTESGAMRKDKKIRRRPKDELLTIELPELRIVPQEVWDRVVERHKEMKSRALRSRRG